MGTEALIEYIRANWLNGFVILSVVVVFVYSAYSRMKMKSLRSDVLKRKEALEKQLDGLNEQLAQQTKQLQEVLDQKDGFIKKGKG